MHRSGVAILYDCLAKQVKSPSEPKKCKLGPKNISKGQSSHITIVSSDGRQQTLTGLAPTYHINTIVYNPKNEDSVGINQKVIADNQGESRLFKRRNINDYKDYNKRKPSPPPVTITVTI